MKELNLDPRQRVVVLSALHFFRDALEGDAAAIEALNDRAIDSDCFAGVSSAGVGLVDDARSVAEHLIESLEQ